ncbi:MAG: DUF6705 family protein [Chitinophagaceae bacterium]|jgi:hypothetical protein|nr:hypothetical protein [Chitinophagaceae bacterium]HAN38421.1 hypothetical protein [Chitinophagaceae bacterium]
MKLLLLTLTIFIAFLSKAQNPNCPPGSNRAAPELDKFVGIWRWVSGTDTLILYLQKQYVEAKPGCNLPSIIGWHRYVQNGRLIESTEQYFGLPYLNDSHAMLISVVQSGINPNATEVVGSSKDITKNKSFTLSLKMLNTNYNQMRWKISNKQGMQKPNFDYGSTLPWDVVLQKL